ncbi:hypothetical protein [Bacillus sp. B15-48]|uniref:hypothetical protein n=1 Tax=Bacillus sp. B15-48 TaxID=1548601 RepID=UPI00193FB0FA|nr:hypothetical protein [Bacillus sp. B15-48]MBM4764396.1 hypothetical protein [Bacillus sp. B15-48]
MDTILSFTYSFAYLVLIVWGIFLAKNYGWLTSANVIMLVNAALFYDNFILAIGKFIGEGNTLENLNYPRYLLHAVFTPILIIFAWDSLKRADIQWVQKKSSRYIALLLYVGLVVYSFFTIVWNLELKAKWEYGILSYEKVGKHGGLMIFIITASLIIASIFIWRRQKWPWLFFGNIVMVIGAILMSKVKSGAVMNGFELILMISITATKHFQDYCNHRNKEK